MLTFCIIRHILRSAVVKSEKSALPVRTSGQIGRTPTLKVQIPYLSRSNVGTKKVERRHSRFKLCRPWFERRDSQGRTSAKNVALFGRKCCVAGTKTADYFLSSGQYCEKTRDFGMVCACVSCGTTNRIPLANHVLEGFAELKTVGTAFGNRKIMNGIVMRVALAPITPMNRDDLVADETANMIHVADDRDGLVSVFRRHGIIVAMKTHRRKRVRIAKLDATAFELLFWERKKKLFLFVKEFGDALFFSRRRLRHVLATLRFKLPVETFKILELRQRHEMIAADSVVWPEYRHTDRAGTPAKQRCDMAFLLRLTYTAEMMTKKKCCLVGVPTATRCEETHVSVPSRDSPRSCEPQLSIRATSAITGRT